jgi:hypothetical protein
MERFNFKKLNDMEVREKYEVKISDRFAALENLNDDDDDDIVRRSVFKFIGSKEAG